MNRKRKSADILAQLGEPLPLPYKAKSTELKREDSFDTLSSSSSVPAHDPLRHRRLFQRKENLVSNNDFFENNYDERMSLPIWKRDRRRVASNNSDIYKIYGSVDTLPTEEHANVNVNENENENEKEIASANANEDEIGKDTQIGEETFFTQLQRQLHQLESLYDSKDAVDTDKRKLGKISDLIQKLIDEKQQQSIVHELERIRREAAGVNASGRNWSGWKVVLWVMVVFLLLSASFFAGQHSYEYCYYFC